jgi:hypothetical protein
MKTLFTSLPEHLLTPAFKKQCKDILKGMNRFLRAAGVDPDTIPNLASFMRRQKLYAAYIEQAIDSGWATFTLNGLVDDRHYAAVAGFLLDGGRLNDEFRVLTESLNTIPMTEDLITRGVRGLHHHMGLIDTPEAVEITLGFATKLFSLWKRKALVDFVQDEMGFSAKATAICTMHALGLEPYPLFGPEIIEALTCTNPELYVPRTTIDPVVDFEASLQGSTHPLDKIQMALESVVRLMIHADVDQEGLIGRIDNLAEVIAGFLEMPVLSALRNDVPAELIWRNLQGRCEMLTKRLPDPEVSKHLATSLAVGVVEAQQKLSGMTLDDSLLIKSQRRLLKRQWQSLSPEQQQLSNAYISRITTKTGLLLTECESKPELRRTALELVLNQCAERNPAALTKLEGLWPEHIDPRLWPVLLDRQSLIHKAQVPALLSFALIASLWSNRAICRRRPGGADRMLYGEVYAFHSYDRVLSESVSTDLVFQQRTLKALHHHGLLDENTISRLGWAGAVLADLGLEMAESVHAAMLENDLGL